jgi:hypothetical protein
MTDRPKCKLCGLEDGACICAHLPPRLSAATTSHLPEFEDQRVQIVYQALCDADLDEPPNRDEHWEGWVSRNIIQRLDGLAQPAVKPAAWQFRALDGTWLPSSEPHEDDVKRYGEDRFRALYPAAQPPAAPVEKLGIMQAAAKAAEKVASWSPSKREYAERVAGAPAAPVECSSCHGDGYFAGSVGDVKCEPCGGTGIARSSAGTTEVRCYGCGSPWNNLDLAVAKRNDPKIISCCPERKPLDIDAWMERAVAAEQKLRTLNEPRTARKALFMCAASCQGGHSTAGKAAAEVLGVPYPVRLESLVEKAVQEGFDPDELWPWAMKNWEHRPASAHSRPQSRTGEA